MRISVIIILTLVFVSCAPIRVTYDFERSANFSIYKTYSYYGDLNTGLSPLDTKRFLDAFDAKMAALGFQFSENPDFLVDIKSAEFQLPQRNTVGVGLGGGGGNMGGGISIGLPIGQSNINRQITIDFVDENGKGLFWQATVESGFNPNASPEKREQLFKTIADKVMAQYPPKL